MENAFECYKCKQIKPVEDNPQWRLVLYTKNDQKIIKMRAPVCTACLMKERNETGRLYL